jgi:hypothetical protein
VTTDREYDGCRTIPVRVGSVTPIVRNQLRTQQLGDHESIQMPASFGTTDRWIYTFRYKTDTQLFNGFIRRQKKTPYRFPATSDCQSIQTPTPLVASRRTNLKSSCDPATTFREFHPITETDFSAARIRQLVRLVRTYP